MGHSVFQWPCSVSACVHQADWDSLSAAGTTQLWPEMRLIEEYRNQKLQPVMHKQWVGQLFCTGMIIVAPDKSLWISLGSVMQVGALLWPATKIVANGVEFFHPTLMDSIDCTKHPHHVPWQWTQIRDIKDWRAIPARWLSPAHSLWKQSVAGAASASGAAGSAAGPASGKSMIGLFAMGTGPATDLIKVTAMHGFKGMGQDVLKMAADEFQPQCPGVCASRAENAIRQSPPTQLKQVCGSNSLLNHRPALQLQPRSFHDEPRFGKIS